jgi:hypothetical protein
MYSKTISKQENLHLISWGNTLQKALKGIKNLSY